MKVLLFRGRGLISSLIRWQTRSQYSHAAFLLADGETIVEAWQGDGVRKKKVTDWSNIDVFHVLGATEAQMNYAANFALAQVGKKYDYRQVFRFLTRIGGKNNGKWFCSELVFAALQHAGINLLERIEPWAVSPGLLALSPDLVKHESRVQKDQ